MIRLWWAVNHGILDKIWSLAVSILLHLAKTLLQICAFSSTWIGANGDM